MIKSLPISHEDDRGIIQDIFVSSPKDHCTFITILKNCIRGNHFHKDSIQYTFVLSGLIKMASVSVDEHGNPTGPIEECTLTPGMLATHKPLHAHAFIAVVDSSFLAFADGTRGGNQYHQDTFRLGTPLL